MSWGIEGRGARADDKTYHSPPAPTPAPALCTILDARKAMLQRPGEEWTCGAGAGALAWAYRFNSDTQSFEEHRARIDWRPWMAATNLELDATDWRPVVAECEKCGQEVRRETTI